MLVLERKMAIEVKVITFSGLGPRKAWQSLIIGDLMEMFQP